MPDNTIGTKVVLNRGRRSYKTSKGLLNPGESLELEVVEADHLLGYDDVVDASQVIAQKAPDEKLVAEIAALKDENAKLKTDIELVKADGLASVDRIATLEKRTADLSAELAAEKEKNAKITEENGLYAEEIEKLNATVEKLKAKGK